MTDWSIEKLLEGDRHGRGSSAGVTCPNDLQGPVRIRGDGRYSTHLDDLVRVIWKN